MEEFQIVDHWRQKVLVRNGVRCTPLAGEVIKSLLEEKETPVSNFRLIETIWGKDYPMDRDAVRVVRNHVCSARKFLKDSKSGYNIVTDRPKRTYKIVKL